MSKMVHRPFHVIFASLLSVSIAGSSFCKPLLQREGVDVTCRNPDSGEVLNCYKDNIPLGAIATYKCSEYYISTNPDLISGQITCESRRKRWHDDFIFTFVFACKIDCGVPKNTRGLIVNGEETEPSKWPWHASIYARESLDKVSGFRYVCGGTLIKPYSKGFVVISAAHCFSNGRSKIKDPKLYKIILGGDSSSYEENQKNQFAQVLGISKIFAHDSFSLFNYQGDIVVVFLDTPVKLSPKILPACFSTTLDVAQPPKVGKLVGFGRYDLNISTVSYTLRQVSLKIVVGSYCSWRETRIQPLEICAGVENGPSPCSGDSGGGLVFQEPVDDNTKRYYLQGIVSAGRRGLVDPNDQCNSYSIFTRIRSYAEWIQSATSLNFDDTIYTENPNKNWPENFTQIGQFGDKVYYTDPNLNVTFEAAKTYCRKVGMESITLESDAQIEYIKTLTDKGDRRYWTTGLSKITFNWDYGIGKLVTIPIGSIKQFCLIVAYWGVYADACDGSYGFKYQPLCTPPPPKFDQMKVSAGAATGVADCSEKFQPNQCWRYCKGNSGDWCYTHSGCENNCNFYECSEVCRKESDPLCVNSCKA